MKNRVKTICAWCKKVIIENEDTPIDKVSHGMCKICIDKLIKGTSEEKQSYEIFDNLIAPNVLRGRM